MGPILVSMRTKQAVSIGGTWSYSQYWAGFHLFGFKYSHSIKILVGILPYVYSLIFFLVFHSGCWMQDHTTINVVNGFIHTHIHATELTG